MKKTFYYLAAFAMMISMVACSSEPAQEEVVEEQIEVVEEVVEEAVIEEEAPQEATKPAAKQPVKEDNGMKVETIEQSTGTVKKARTKIEEMDEEVKTVEPTRKK
jgi:uncharacterized protein YcfL